MYGAASPSALRWVTGFTLLYLGVASLFSVRLENWEFVLYVFVVFIIGLFVLNLHGRVMFSAGVLWTLSIWGLLHMMGGLVPVPEWVPIGGEKHVLYNAWLIRDFLRFDHIVHGYGFGICTWIIWQVLRPLITGPKPHPAEAIVALLAANGLGAFNELIEFLAVMWIPNTNVGGYENTGWDLVANLVGSVIAVVIITYGQPVRIPHRKKRQRVVSLRSA